MLYASLVTGSFSYPERSGYENGHWVWPGRGMAVCDYAISNCHSNPADSECDVFLGKTFQKLIMGGSKYFSDLFRPQFSEHVAQFQHSGAPSGKVGPPFKLTFFF